MFLGEDGCRGYLRVDLGLGLGRISTVVSGGN